MNVAAEKKAGTAKKLIILAVVLAVTVGITFCGRMLLLVENEGLRHMGWYNNGR